MVKYLSDKLALKLINDRFKNIQPQGWLITKFRYMIDWKYGLRKDLDLFLKSQVDNPDKTLFRIVEENKKFGKTNDEKIINILKYVHENTQYKTDLELYGYDEKWVEAWQVATKKMGDCEDLNGMIYVLARLSGIPEPYLYCAIGDTCVNGHFWLIYLSNTNLKLFSIDATVYPDTTEIKNRKEFALSSIYKTIWYIFSEAGVWK